MFLGRAKVAYYLFLSPVGCLFLCWRDIVAWNWHRFLKHRNDSFTGSLPPSVTLRTIFLKICIWSHYFLFGFEYKKGNLAPNVTIKEPTLLKTQVFLDMATSSLWYRSGRSGIRIAISLAWIFFWWAPRKFPSFLLLDDSLGILEKSNSEK